MKDNNRDMLPLLIPEMPSPADLMPWLHRIHASKQYSNFGPLVRELEEVFSENFSVEKNQLVTVSNATLGLELVLQALNLKPGSKILVPAFTFVATATAVVRAGYIPVIADVDSKSWMLTPKIARNIFSATSVDAVLAVATFGMPYDMKEWEDFENQTGIPVVIDAAAAYGNQWLNRNQGTLVFSLHATKSLPAGEGGLVVSTRPGLAEKVRQLTNFGINLNSQSSMPIGHLAGLGTNAKMSEYHAAICLASLTKWCLNAKRRKFLYEELVSEINYISAGRIDWQSQNLAGPINAPTLLCASMPDSYYRDKLEGLCYESSVLTRRWYQPLIQKMQVLEGICVKLPCPNAEILSERLIGLPFFIDMSNEQKNRLLNILRLTFS